MQWDFTMYVLMSFRFHTQICDTTIYATFSICLKGGM